MAIEDDLGARPIAWCADLSGLRRFGLKALHRGALVEALAFTDRLCRIQSTPQAADWLARAFVHHRSGHHADFAADLDRAMTVGWYDPVVLRAVIALHPETCTRLLACHALVSSQRATWDDLRFALTRLAAAGERLAIRVARTPLGLDGWLACRSATAIRLHARTDDDREPVNLEAVQDDRLNPAWRLLTFSLAASPTQPVELDVAIDGQSVLKSVDIPRPIGAPQESSGYAVGSIRADVVVVVPIYGDPSSLERCLKSLRTQDGRLRVHHVVVDDCSDEARVSALGRSFCMDTGGTFVRHALNSGFAAAVNTALARIASGDVLVLNSDVELPAGAIARLHEAAHGVQGIGTVAPFSNDAGSASFPKPFERNPLLSEDEAHAVDAAAARVNAGKLVDVVSNLGSCLYITDVCRRSVGPFSLAYGRGYYEDVDFCFRAREAGFRNVVAANLYVGHASSRSFGEAKRQLAAENRLVVESRFPGLDEVEETFMRADPLRPERAAIEDAIFCSTRPAILVVAMRNDPSLVLEQRCSVLSSEKRVLTALWAGTPERGSIELRGREGQLPQSLSFELDWAGLGTLARYLDRQAIEAIEICDADRAPPPLVRCMAALAPCTLLVSSASETRFAERTRLAGRPSSGATDGPVLRADQPFLACDRMSAARLGLTPHLPASAPTSSGPSVSARQVLGVVMPNVCARSERFVLALARHLRRERGVCIHVFGSCIDDTQLMSVGNAWVHGGMTAGEVAPLARNIGVGALLSPFREAHFGLLGLVAEQIGCPKAFFDWSEGRLSPEPHDLALPADLEDAAALDRLTSWCTTILPDHEHAS